jgi:polynucleotide 5'-hydroxyl-kinase GRC3/NOL9
MDIVPEPAWEALLKELMARPGIVLLLGGTSSGKTALALFVIRELLGRGVPAALVDSDIGQSSLGPPGTVSLKSFRTRVDMEHAVPDRMAFVGGVNPGRHIGEVIHHTVRLARSAPENVVLVDSSGLVDGDPGRALKLGKVRALRPAHVVALERGEELEHILGEVRGPRIWRMHVSPKARSRSRAERAAYRERKFREHFEGASVRCLDAGRVAFSRGRRSVEPGFSGLSPGLCVGLNRGEDTLALGVVEAAEGGRICLYTSLASLSEVDTLALGEEDFRCAP